METFCSEARMPFSHSGPPTIPATTLEHTVRLTPLPEAEWDEEVIGAVAGMLPKDRRNPRGAGTALATLVRHPALTKSFLAFDVHLLFRSTLPDRVRELAILRVAHRRGCGYEAAHHTHLAEQAGLSPEEVEAARRGEAAGELDQAVLTAVDELDETSNLTDKTWDTLRRHLDERQLMDLVFTIGGYCLLAMAFNTFGVELEDER
jgi:4-carboxymuconolactone decarboxylase